MEWEVLSRRTFKNTHQAQAIVIDWCYKTRHKEPSHDCPGNHRNAERRPLTRPHSQLDARLADLDQLTDDERTTITKSSTPSSPKANSAPSPADSCHRSQPEQGPMQGSRPRAHQQPTAMPTSEVAIGAHEATSRPGLEALLHTPSPTRHRSDPHAAAPPRWGRLHR